MKMTDAERKKVAKDIRKICSGFEDNELTAKIENGADSLDILDNIIFLFRAYAIKLETDKGLEGHRRTTGPTGSGISRSGMRVFKGEPRALKWLMLPSLRARCSLVEERQSFVVSNPQRCQALEEDLDHVFAAEEHDESLVVSFGSGLVHLFVRDLACFRERGYLLVQILDDVLQLIYSCDLTHHGETKLMKARPLMQNRVSS